MKTSFEHRSEEVLSTRNFYLRILSYVLRACVVIGFSLGIGIGGYHYFEDLPWIDSFLNAAMILGGMGPVNPILTSGGKIFAGCYALFSGIIFIVVAGLLLGPLMHRVLHRFHFDSDQSSLKRTRCKITRLKR